MRICRSAISIMVSSVALITADCGAAERPGGVAWQAVHDTIGNTIVVRTVAGSVWGEPADLVPELRIGVFEGADEYMFGNLNGIAVADDGSIYAFDRQALALRKYSPDGTYLATFGRAGGGPGEYRDPDSGLAVLPDGRVALRDPANARITLYSAEGEHVGSWPMRGGMRTSRPLYVDTAGTVSTQIVLESNPAASRWRTGLVQINADGALADTLAEPAYDYDPPMIRAERVSSDGKSRMLNADYVPFSPTVEWTFSPHGYMIGGISNRYAIDLFRTTEPHLRIERDYEPVPVKAGEKSDAERRAVAQMRTVDPGWRWNGSAIPDRKPAFKKIIAGQDGRVWVQLHQPGYEVEVEGPDEPGRVPPARWREPVVFDLFEADGRYLGQVRAPEGFSLSPTPVMRGDHVWAVVRDELDVQYITRFRIDRAM